MTEQPPNTIQIIIRTADGRTIEPLFVQVRAMETLPAIVNAVLFTDQVRQQDKDGEDDA